MSNSRLKRARGLYGELRDRNSIQLSAQFEEGYQLRSCDLDNNVKGHVTVRKWCEVDRSCFTSFGPILSKADYPEECSPIRESAALIAGIAANSS